ncbi:ParB/RepB/Spo0J family partition protein [Helicobacter acinonychis]|uniref:Chromosome partitioning protein parB n=1 Tax=Helicobacter acinonychis (strain Sheeba) TaxID=382638 RepID=Q17Y84_HELAH|nr:ParB/RepB/Spo0J family partition protein [Helicobacter acinonychis]CAJ99392.1 chromosome partitioning protein parB [Helicobacter acinonychis str. Sheeba]STP03971.1 plasmid replication-partition related protein [Helicobacter acinonychis]
MAKNKVLGRGLADIFPEINEVYEQGLYERANRVIELGIDEVMPNPYQPRKVFSEDSLEELAQSIKEHGLLQPVLVVSENGRYHLIAGERRLRASKLAKMQTIKAIVVDIEQEKMREVALIENIQREDLNPLELAKSYKELLESYQMTQEELSKIVKKSRAHVANIMRLLTLSSKVQNALLEEKITSGHAKVLVGLDEKKQELILNSIIGQKLSVRQTEDLARDLKTTPHGDKKHGLKRTQTLIAKDELKRFNQNLWDHYKLKAALKGDKIVLQCYENSLLKAFIKKIMS